MLREGMLREGMLGSSDFSLSVFEHRTSDGGDERKGEEACWGVQTSVCLSFGMDGV